MVMIFYLKVAGFRCFCLFLFFRMGRRAGQAKNKEN